MYFANREKNTLNYLAKAEKLDRYIVTIGGVIDYIKAKKRSKKTIGISFDEWNVWYHSNQQDKEILARDERPDAPHLLEDVYNFEDVLQVGGILNTFIRRSDRVRIACIAQLVNVIAPIMTEDGGPAWRQTIYYPLYFASKYGRGYALRLVTDGPTYDSDEADDVPYLDVSAVHDEMGKMVTLFAVNRHPDSALDLDTRLEGFAGARVVEQHEIVNNDLQATNIAAHPNAVVPTNTGDAKIEDGRLRATLKPLSYTVIRLAV
jgi:alpha-N-arabinofuranosidase